MATFTISYHECMATNTHSIYTLTNRLNGMIYVGATNDPKRRLIDHHHWKPGRRTRMARIVDEVGRDNFEFAIVDTASEADRDRKEAGWIKRLGTLHPNGYNMESGGKQGYRMHPDSIERMRATSAVGIAVLLLLMVFNASPVQAREGVCPAYSEPVADAERNDAVTAKLSVLLWGPWSPSAQAVHAALGQQDGSYWLVGRLNGWHVNVAPGSKSLGQSRAALESTIRAFFTPKDADLLVKELQVHAVPYAREELEAVQRALQAEIDAEGCEPGTYDVGIDCRASDAPRVELWLSEGIRASHGAQAQAIASHFGDRAALDLGPSKLSFVGGGLGSAPPSTGAPLIPTAGPTISGAGRLTPASVHVTVTAPAPETVTLKLTGRNPAFQITRHVRLRMGRNTLHLRLPRSVGRQLRRRTRMSSNLVVTGATGAAVRKDVRLLR